MSVFFRHALLRVPLRDFRSRSKFFGVELITGHVRFFRTCPTAGSASGLPPLKRWYVRHTPLITRITTKATALHESGLYKILLGSNNIAQPGAANCANRAGGAAGLRCRAAGASQPLARKSVLQSSPHGRTGFFFLGRIPTLARARQGSDAGQVARPGGYARQAPSRRTLTVPGLLAIRAICAIWLSQGKPLNIHSPPGPCYMCYMCYMVSLCTIHIASPTCTKYALYSTYSTF